MQLDNIKLSGKRTLKIRKSFFFIYLLKLKAGTKRKAYQLKNFIILM